MKLVIIESPYAGDVANNILYARECLVDSLKRGEAPFASHLLYTQALNDDEVVERRKGILAGHAWMRAADYVAVYTDRGLSRGMARGIRLALKLGKPIHMRTLHTKEPT